jgi:hypothetical protein
MLGAAVPLDGAFAWDFVFFRFAADGEAGVVLDAP